MSNIQRQGIFVIILDKVGETMKLSMLEKSVLHNRVLIFQTSSVNVNMYVMDKIKALLRCNHDTILEVTDKKSIKNVKEIYNVEPYLSDRWLVVVHLDKFKGKYQDIVNMILDSSTVMFVCVAERYPDFKGFRDAVNKVKMQQVCELYLTYMRAEDFHYLYRTIVPESNRMPKAIADFVCQSYGADIDAEFELFNQLKEGTKVTTRKAVSEICGIGGNSIDSFVMSLLKDPPQTEKGSITVIRNRLKAGEDLAQVYGYGKFYNYLSSCIKQLMDLKMLIMSGVVYNRIPELPKGYDEKKLMRYQRYIWRVRRLPFSRLVRLKLFVGDIKWKSSMDLLRFVYGYYKDLIQYEVVPYLPKTSAVDDYVIAKEKEDKAKQEEKRVLDELSSRRAVQLIRQYGVVEGRRRFAEEKKTGIKVTQESNVSSLIERPARMGMNTSNSAETDNSSAAAFFREFFKE